MNVKDTAREWLVKLSLGEPTPQERAEFEAWCHADPGHIEAYERFEQIWNETPDVEVLRDPALLEEYSFSEKIMLQARFFMQNIRQTALRPTGMRTMGAAASIFLVFAVVQFGSRSFFGSQYVTQLAEIRDVELSDGSIVTLGAQSSIDVVFTDQERRVSLRGGAGLFLC